MKFQLKMNQIRGETSINIQKGMQNGLYHSNVMTYELEIFTES